MDKTPTPAPFPIGARVLYTGTLRLFHQPTDRTPFFECGCVGRVVRNSAGRQGTLRHLRDEDGPMYDDAGEPIVDTTRHGYSVVDFGNGWTRAVRADDFEYEQVD
jgi:hypothetical protein